MRSSAVIPTQQATAAQYNNLRNDAYASSWLLAHQQTVADLTLYIESGNVTLNGTLVQFAGGGSASFSAPTSHPRIDVLTLTSGGSLAIVTGTEASSPVAPVTSNFAICQIYNRVGQTKILDADDSVNGYIYKDVRPFLASGGRNFTDILTTGEALTATAPLPIFIAPSPTAYDVLVSRSNGSANNAIANNGGQPTQIGALQNGVGNIGRVSFFLATSANGLAGSITASIWSDNGSGTAPGSLLYSSTTTRLMNTMNTTYTTITFDFAPGASVSGNFWIVLSATGITSGYMNWQMAAFGGGGEHTAAYQGSWNNMWNNATYTAASYIAFTSGEIYQSDGTDTARQRCDGFALSTAAQGASVPVVAEGFIDGFSGLTAGADYYLGSGGTITTTSNSYKVGRAVSSTKLLIRKY